MIIVQLMISITDLEEIYSMASNCHSIFQVKFVIFVSFSLLQDVTLDELMREEEFLQECQSSNKKLLEL